jgi:2-keto-3-deoxy-L-rhamnonate aldolase RhmA
LASFKTRLRAGEILVAPMITLRSTETAELLAGLGYDWLFIDTEHAPIEPADVYGLLQAAGSVPCLIRLSSSEPTAISKALDAGAAGIIVPQVNSAEQARRIVDCAKYAPAGSRGRGVARAHGYGSRLAEYSQTANDTVVVVVQAEHPDAVGNIDAIVDVAGLDAVFVGPYDLASSLGHPGEVDHPEVLAAIARVRDACRAKGLPAGILGISAQAAGQYVDEGFTLVIAGIDVLILGDGARAMLGAVRNRSGRRV